MDLLKLEANDTTVLEVMHPKRDVPVGIKITLAGPSHEASRQAIRAMQDRQAKRKIVSPEADERDLVEVLAARTLGWDGIESNGKPLPFSIEAAKELYANPKLYWLRKQVFEAGVEDARFFDK